MYLQVQCCKYQARVNPRQEPPKPPQHLPARPAPLCWADSASHTYQKTPVPPLKSFHCISSCFSSLTANQPTGSAPPPDTGKRQRDSSTGHETRNGLDCSIHPSKCPLAIHSQHRHRDDRFHSPTSINAQRHHPARVCPISTASAPKCCACNSLDLIPLVSRTGMYSPARPRSLLAVLAPPWSSGSGPASTCLPLCTLPSAVQSRPSRQLQAPRAPSQPDRAARTKTVLLSVGEVPCLVCRRASFLFLERFLTHSPALLTRTLHPLSRFSSGTADSTFPAQRRQLHKCGVHNRRVHKQQKSRDKETKSTSPEGERKKKVAPLGSAPRSGALAHSSRPDTAQLPRWPSRLQQRPRQTPTVLQQPPTRSRQP